MLVRMVQNDKGVPLGLHLVRKYDGVENTKDTCPEYLQCGKMACLRVYLIHRPLLLARRPMLARPITLGCHLRYAVKNMLLLVSTV